MVRRSVAKGEEVSHKVETWHKVQVHRIGNDLVKQLKVCRKWNADEPQMDDELKSVN